MFLDAKSFADVEGLGLAGFLVAVPFIPGDELGAGGDNGDAYVGGLVFAGVVYGCRKKVLSDAMALSIRPYAEQAEI